MASAASDAVRSTTGNGPFTLPTYASVVETYVVRVWIPDRPGALGAVASRIGAVHGGREFWADWAAVLDDVDETLRASQGPVPEAPWLLAFVRGSSTSEAVASGRSGPDELAWASLPSARLHLVLGRAGVQLRAVE